MPVRYVDGIAILSSSGNLVLKNTFVHNGPFSGVGVYQDIALDGISLFRGASDNVVGHNTVEVNGYHNAAHRKGDGIRVFSDRNVIEDNLVFGNAADGIGVGFIAPRGVVVPAVDNQILDNKTGQNVLFDLHDLNPGGDDNVWAGNSFDRADPLCTTAG